MLFILNKNYEVVESLNSRGNMAVITPYFDDEYLQDLATGAETFTFSTLADSIQSQHLVVGNFIAFRYKDEYKLFNIINVEEEHTDLFIKNVYCEMASIELINEIVRPMNFSGTARSFVNTILRETSWQLGNIDAGFTEVFDLNLTDYKSAYSLLQEHMVNTFGAEISYRVEIKNNKIVGKYVDIHSQRGSDKGLRFAYSKNLTSIKRTIDTSNIATALIGVGKNNITFKDLDLPDKPAGQDFIVSESAYRLWSVNGNHIMGTHKADTDSPQELLKLTREALVERSVPQTKYEMQVELLGEEVEIGDTVKIVDHGFNPPIYLEGRINQLKISQTDPTKNECVLANFKEIGSNISAELKELAGYIDSKFPVGTNDIKDGAINGDKLHNGQIITGTHLFANSITTDHLKADAITAEKIKADEITTDHLQANSITAEKIKADQITTDHLQAHSITAEKLTTGELITSSAQIGSAVINSAHINEGVIESVHIKDGAIDTIHINDGSITSAKIGDAQIGTAQIKDAEITVAKIQNAFVDSLVANQGKFQSAHIGVLTSDNIDAETIKAEHIQASVIDAINLNVEGKISADRIDVGSLTVDEIDAGKITSGTIDANRINGSVISAINASIESATIDSAKIGELDASKITSGEISTDILKSNIITAINASIGKISADHIDVSSIKVDKIDAGAIVSGTVDAQRITGSVVQAINLSAQKIDAKNINVEGLKVGSANIVEGSINSVHISEGQITNAHINTAFVADGYIKNLNASVITTGTLDANKVTIKNLKADSIVAGSITVQGENLIHGTEFKDLTKWSGYSSTVTIDSSKKHGETNSVKMVDVCNLYSEFIPATKGDTFVISAKTFMDAGTAPASKLLFILEEYNATSTTRLHYQETAIITTYDQWVDYVKSWTVSNAETTRIRLRIYNRATGTTWVTKPMLSRGTIASIWKPHTDELISDGAIDNDKIANETITADKLVIDSIWADEGFISNFQSANIDAGQITTGKITGEFLDIEGFIKFTDLDSELSDNFIRPTDSAGNILGTYINGATIHTGTLHGDQIVANGFTAKDKLDNTTFNIDKDTGEVTMSGEVKSMNYSDVAGNEQGYMLTPDGNAYLNDAIIRGSVITPEGGMSNYGAKNRSNLIQLSSIAKVDTTGSYDSKNNIWNLVSTSGQGATWGAGLKITGNKTIIPYGSTYICSFEIKVPVDCTWNVDVNNYAISGTSWSGNDNDNSSLRKTSSKTLKANVWTKCWFSYENTKSTNTEKISIYDNSNFGIINNTGSNIEFQIRNVKGELGTEPTAWCPNEKDDIKLVRFWAGSTYEDRADAPFIVYDDGSIKATQGEFGGVFSGKVSIGNIHIEDTNTTNGFIDIKTNNNTETKIHLEENSSYIRSELEIGNNFVNFNTDDKQMTVNGLQTLNNGKYTTKLNNGANIAETSDGKGTHLQRYSDGTYVYEAKGSNGYGDFLFKRADTAVDVRMDGNLYVRDRLTMNNNIAIVARQDAGNSGFDYVVN